jgi:predicted metal-dependent phosphoesterase TrpH
VRRIDLHTHSTASDGTFTPRELIKLARFYRLAGLALCDHDTVEGTDEFQKAGQEFDFLAISGVEISLEFLGITHLLGLNLGQTAGSLAVLSNLQKLRVDRNQKIFDKLRELEFELSWDRIAEISGGGQVGRPHFARAMVEKGYCHSPQEAFDRYLGKKGLAYVDKVRPRPAEAIRFLRQANFAPVIAHPVSINLASEKWPETLAEWKAAGLVGVEAYHPDHSPKATIFFRNLAKRFDLVVTAGSDFHGANKKVPLSWVKDHSPLGVSVLESLRAKLTSS